MYLSDLRVYFKLEVYFRVTEVGWRSTKIAGKTSGLCQHYQRWIYCWPEGLFHGWFIYSYLQIFKLIKCKWLPGECADWFLDNIMTWSYCLHRRYSMSWQKDSISTNEHALNREPVRLRWFPRVFTNNPSYLTYVTEGNLVTLSLRFCSWNSPLRLPI